MTKTNFEKQSKQKNHSYITYGIICLIALIGTPGIIEDQGGWTFTNIILFPIYFFAAWVACFFVFFIFLKIPFIVLIRTPYRLLKGEKLIQKNICPFCEQEVSGWLDKENPECRNKFNKDLNMIKGKIDELLKNDALIDFKSMLDGASESSINYLNKYEGRKYLKKILENEFILIESISVSRRVNKLVQSLAEYFEIDKGKFLELLDEDNALSSNLGYAFENLITPLLDDFLIDDKESVNLESTFQEMQNIMPFTLAGLSNDITAGILYGNQLYRLKNNIKLNEVSLPSGILLQKNENPIMSFKRIGCYSLNIKTKYRGRSTGGSYKLSSKLIIRHSEHRGRPISYSEWDFIGNGQLVLTNKHIYFLGDGSARDHKEKIASIISFDPTSDGFIINLNFKTRPAVRYKMDQHSAFYCTNMLSMTK